MPVRSALGPDVPDALLGFPQSVVQVGEAPGVVGLVVELDEPEQGFVVHVAGQEVAGVDGVVARPVAGLAPVLEVLEGVVDEADNAQQTAGLGVDGQAVDVFVDLDDVGHDGTLGVAVAGDAPLEAAPELRVFQKGRFEGRLRLEVFGKLGDGHGGVVALGSVLRGMNVWGGGLVARPTN